MAIAEASCAIQERTVGRGRGSQRGLVIVELGPQPNRRAAEEAARKKLGVSAEIHAVTPAHQAFIAASKLGIPQIYPPVA